MTYPLLGILGGTFDPIHNGHLYIADQVIQHLGLQQLLLIPCKQPVLKTSAHARAADRLAMLELASEALANIHIDKREILRDSPSYMVDTLASLQQDYPEQALCLIVGRDAFNDLPKWHQWQQLLSLCHLIVIERPNCPAVNDPVLEQLIAGQQVDSVSALKQTLAGCIYFLTCPPTPLSSTGIRQAIADGEMPKASLPNEVWPYIQKNKLYKNREG